jgi:hypothetical protein
MSQQSCQSCIIIIDSALYKGRFTDRNRGTIFPNYIFHAFDEDCRADVNEGINGPAVFIVTHGTVIIRGYENKK